MNGTATLPSSQQSERSFRYTNPITRDPLQSIRDPMLLKAGNGWFMTGTSQSVWGRQNPGLRLMELEGFLSLEDAGWCIDASKIPKDCPYIGRFWAPELHHIQGKFYLFVNSGPDEPKAGNSRIYNHLVRILESDKIVDPYKFLTPTGLVLADPKIFTNDGTMFADDRWNAFKKMIGRQDPGNPDWMIGGIEEPWVMKKHGSCWMFFSSWSRGYEVRILWAESLLRHWKLAQREPVFGSRKRARREEIAKKHGYSSLVFEDTKDPYVEAGHNVDFKGTQEQLGVEPLLYEDGRCVSTRRRGSSQELKWLDENQTN